MELMLWFFGYIIIGLITSLPITRFSYRKALKDNKNPIPKAERGALKRSAEKIDELETKRRKKLSTEALTTGFWCGVFWPVVLVAFVILFIVGMGMKVVHTLTIKPEDQPFISEKEMRKAQSIVDKYHMEQKTQFEKELGE